MNAHTTTPVAPVAPTTRRAGHAARQAARSRRRGTASLLAMLYLIIFAALALGFYAQTNVSAQISNNERAVARAMTAADSGMALMRRQLADLTTPYVAENQILTEVANELYDQMMETPNLTLYGHEVGMSEDGSAVLIPKDERAAIPLGDGTGFRCTIRRTGRTLVVSVVGRTNVDARGVVNGSGASSLGKGIEYTFEPKQIPAPIFDYGVVGRGQVELSGNADVKGGTNPAYGNILTTTSTNPAIVTGSNAVITGQVILTNPAATTSYHTASYVGGSNTVAGRTAATIKPPDARAKAPEFPVIDTSIYLPFIKRTVISTTAGATYRNFRVPAGLNLTFSDVKLEGVIYIEAPNIITFNSNTLIRGTIVTPNTPMVASTTTNAINIAGQATSYDMKTLADIYLPDNPIRLEFPPELLALSGASIIAPGFKVSMSGGYASLSGSIIADQIAMSGNAGGYITGSLIQLNKQKLTITGSGGVIMEKPSSTMWPAGLYFRSYYEPRHKSYREFPAPRIPPPSTSGGSLTSPLEPITDPITGITQ
jgi:hypothetical protein